MLRAGRYLVALALAACAGVQHPPSPTRQTHLGLDLAGLTLDNGLRVVVVHDPNATTVHVTARYAVGAADEPVGQAGIAHLVEHALFLQVHGTQPVGTRLEQIATSHNADTTYDATTYWTEADPSHLDELLAIESARVGLRCTSVSQAAFEREREVVVNELRMRDASTQVLAALHRGLYPDGHPYRAALGGDETSVRAITRDAACAFADRYYTPASTVLVISGNVTAQQVQPAIAKFFGHVARRPAAARVVLPVAAGVQRVELQAPIAEDSLLYAWSVPDDPIVQVRMRALAAEAAQMIDGEIRGTIALVELGDRRAPKLAFLIAPADGESSEDIQHGVETGLGKLASALPALGASDLGKVAFDRIQQSAIYNLFAGLEEPVARDHRLAELVLAGHDPSEALALEFRGLRELNGRTAAAIVREQFAVDQAQVALLHAVDKQRRAHVELATPIHDLGRRRDPPDPELAHQPLPAVAVTSAVRVRTLANGMRVVLVPSTTVPTVDVRLVFAAGSADDPPARRGAAQLAGHGLGWDFHYANDAVAFLAAGGEMQVDVGPDHVVFEARGVDMHLDYLLAGLRRWVRDGHYTDDTIAAARNSALKRSTTDETTSVWRTALFGIDHPYVAAGDVHRWNAELSAKDAAAYRSAHFTPDNATLVIAGHFDPALADRWIDFLFADWTGHHVALATTRVVAHPEAVAIVEDGPQVGITLAVPARTGTRAMQLVAAAMLDDIARDVRHELGASYDIRAELSIARLARNYVVRGSVQGARAREALELLRARCTALRENAEVAARGFVAARERLVAQLASSSVQSRALAAEIVDAIAGGDAADSELTMVAAIRALTIEQVTPVLADLDLARATIALAGPNETIADAFAPFGRTPSFVTTRKPVPPPDIARLGIADRPGDYEEYPDALTAAAEPRRARSLLALGASLAYATRSVQEHDGGGFAAIAEAGVNYDPAIAFGLHLGIARLDGDYREFMLAPAQHFTILPVDVALYAQGTVRELFWGKVTTGLHLDRLDTTWHTSAALGLYLGMDVVTLAGVRFGPYAAALVSVGGDVPSSGFQLGIGVRN